MGLNCRKILSAKNWEQHYNIVKRIILILIFSSAVSNAEWVYVANGANIYHVNTFGILGNIILAGTSEHGVYLSKNGGTKWSQTSLDNQYVMSLAVKGNIIFAGTGIGIFKSVDTGKTWIQTALNFASVGSLAVTGNTIFAGTALPSNGIYFSSDNGLSWIQTSLNDKSIYSICINGNTIFAGSNSNGVYISLNNGTSWTQTSLNNKTILSICANENFVFAGAAYEQGVFISSNNGATWSQTSLNNIHVNTLLLTGNSIFAGTSFGGVFASNNNGISWIQRNEGLAGGLAVHDLIVFNDSIYSASNNGIYRRPLDELTSIEQISNEGPIDYYLCQNYPNPFNPVTKISFSIPVPLYVRLVVYDLQGKEVELMVNKNMSPGTYQADWDAANYSSGVYFYRLEAGDFTEIRKMALVK
jgi:hypothetical protein